MYRGRFNITKQRRARGRATARAVTDQLSAQSFYRDLLGGRQLWPTERDSPGDSLWFFVGPTLVEVSPTRAGMLETLELAVDSPASVAERCWDSGYTVRLPAQGAPGEVIVVDPFGRPIALVPRLSECSLGVEAAG